MSAFWKGARRGIVLAWLVAGPLATIAFVLMDHWPAALLCAFGFGMAISDFRGER